MGGIFLVLQVPVTGAKTDLHIEPQAHNGLRLWLKHFETVVVACPYSPISAEPTIPISSIPGSDKLRIVTLEQAWQPHQFVRRLPSVARVLKEEIDKAEHLQFGIGGLWGDWGSVAAWVAHLKRRPYAVWTDHVESDFHFKKATGKRFLSALYTKATAAAMVPYERAIIRRSALGLFHGADCFAAYAKFCRNPHLVHNVHIGADQHISDEDLSARLTARQGKPLRIAYAGRAAPEKGTLDWVKAIAHARKVGTNLEATWFGDGPDLLAAMSLSQELSLPISFPGAIPHDQLLQKLKEFDIFVFCHKTLESPRCLIEALACGLPIVGYSSAYPKNLTKKYWSGVMTRMGRITGLGEAIANCVYHQDLLPQMSFLAKQDAADLTDEAVFAHRAKLIKSIKLPNQTTFPVVE